MLNEDYKEMLQLLLDNNVKFLVTQTELLFPAAQNACGYILSPGFCILSILAFF